MGSSSIFRSAGILFSKARVDGQYAALHDQAGRMVRVDAQNWVKCGTEFFDHARHASVVFTREFSDLSTMNDPATSGPVWWRVVREPDSLETLCSSDGKRFTSVPMGYLVRRPPPRSAFCALLRRARDFSAYSTTWS
jgi:uncharacterized protein